MGLVIDLIIVAIIILTVIISAKHGFVRIFIEVAGFIAAVFISLTINTPLANITYDTIIEPQIVKTITDTADETAKEISDNVWEKLPAFVKNGSNSVSEQKLKIENKLAQQVGNEPEKMAKTVSQTVIKPLFVRFIALIYAIIILLILLIVVKISAVSLNKLFSFSLIGKVNRILGGIVGIPKGIVLALLFCIIITVAMSFSKDGFLIFNKENLSGSIIYSYVAKNLLK